MSDWPSYYKELLYYGNPDSPVGIVTLWTMCDRVIKDMNKDSYHLAGQLYTKNGINYLVRNLLANKKLRYLVICGQDRGGAGGELHTLWKTGKSDFLHKEIDQESLQNMIKYVQLIDLVGIEDGAEIEAKIQSVDLSVDSYGEPETFPEPEQKQISELECAWPAESSVFRVEGKTVAETWLKAVKTILKFGDVKETDAMKMKEVLNICAVVMDETPDNFFVPQFLGFDQQKIDEYLPQIVTGEKNEGLHYTYGNRLQKHFAVNQVEKIVEKLKADKNAREAVGIFFDPNADHDAEHRPCLTLIQTIFNKEKLNLNVYVRSHDMFGGWPLNAFGLRTLQKIICDKAGLPMGVLTIISASAHIYDFNWEQAQSIVKQHLKLDFEPDWRGYFKIDINKESQTIEAQHFSTEGLLLKKYTQSITHPKAALHLATAIIKELGISLIPHALDMGIELSKAETALRLGVDYIQDKPLKIISNS